MTDDIDFYEFLTDCGYITVEELTNDVEISLKVNTDYPSYFAMKKFKEILEEQGYKVGQMFTDHSGKRTFIVAMVETQGD